MSALRLPRDAKASQSPPRLDLDTLCSLRTGLAVRAVAAAPARSLGVRVDRCHGARKPRERSGLTLRITGTRRPHPLDDGGRRHRHQHESQRLDVAHEARL